MQRNAVDMLTQWGNWVKSGRSVDLGYKSAMMQAMNLVLARPCGIFVDITDDDAVMIDRAIAMLRQFDSDGAEILFLVFVRDYGMRRIASKFNLSHGQAAQRFQNCCGSIEFAINVTFADKKCLQGVGQ